ncbi:sporulation protein YqfC [Clostridium luticellarii]|uniref:YabP family protein n=1 Tax=Clostridium luticellarii TaxID=1691940 RepID=A0A2T0BM07_9CLOT|nr:sporulation protein YqfC [Clostridium luticellarii]MCI1944105.1 sporulation protein YqfC [Clostridium luticellarii]MCI1967253.1 sporulation protein YqfC [Clostridium luticellarii]MCI1995164.1 sporulation protein YqfC [Clostridium luticellarii]MCI2039340.1 sporulation protein YqfC [Clostridium luticellarii]PRR84908.1 YabP family protein [Clostridium luticellarii]
MKNKMYDTKQNIADKLDLPRDIILNMPQIKIMGDNEIVIENHNGIILFDDSQVKINSGIGLISIYGSKFEVLFIGGSTITIGGKFKSIVYEGN